MGRWGHISSLLLSLAAGRASASAECGGCIASLLLLRSSWQVLCQNRCVEGTLLPCCPSPSSRSAPPGLIFAEFLNYPSPWAPSLSLDLSCVHGAHLSLFSSLCCYFPGSGHQKLESFFLCHLPLCHFIHYSLFCCYNGD